MMSFALHIGSLLESYFQRHHESKRAGPALHLSSTVELVLVAVGMSGEPAQRAGECSQSLTYYSTWESCQQRVKILFFYLSNHILLEFVNVPIGF